MIALPDLRTALLDLLYETRQDNLRLIIGGGYGIYLKREHVRATGVRTLLTEWPEVRSTNDLDLFLRPDLLIHSQRLQPLGAALKRLGYQVIAGAEKYQFAKPGPSGGQEGSFKIDLLTGPTSRFAGTAARADERRVRPRPSVDVHAHPVDEALTLEEGLLLVTVEGETSSGTVHRAEVYLPQPLTFAMMKLFAFRDRVTDKDKDLGRYHALDLYAVLATASEAEWEEALTLREQRQAEPMMIEAAQIVDEYFSSLKSLGMLRLQESPYFRQELQLDMFFGALRELFPPVTKEQGA
jgi:hypothetical protein